MTTKYPIILAHGILLKEKGIFFRSFSYIKKHLTAAGYRVYIAQTDGIGTIENNAAQLKKEIQEILEKEKTEKINIIGHSKGGLDSIYMLENLDMGDKVASLTTLCTPHQGSPVATTLLKMPKIFLYPLAFFYNVFYKCLKDENPDIIAVLKQLQVRETPFAEHLKCEEGYCQSYSLVMEKAGDEFLMSVPFIMSKRYEKEDTDGMVSHTSAQFGEYKGVCLEESFSHHAIVCFAIGKKKREKVFAFYDDLCKDLAERGY